MTKRMVMTRSEAEWEGFIATPTEWAYLAGIIDGEGSIVIQSGQPHVSFTQVNPRIVNWAEQIFGGRKNFNIRYKPEQIRKHQPCYRWGVHSKPGCRVILSGILPFLVLKRKKAKEALRACTPRS